MQLFSECEEHQKKDAFLETKENKMDSDTEAEQRIMEWAKELQKVSEVCVCVCVL